MGVFSHDARDEDFRRIMGFLIEAKALGNKLDLYETGRIVDMAILDTATHWSRIDVDNMCDAQLQAIVKDCLKRAHRPGSGFEEEHGGKWPSEPPPPPKSAGGPKFVK